MSSTRTPAVRLNGITKRFGDVLANDEVDFTLEKGSVHALVGENGAGKSTLMNVLYGLYHPNAGRIIIDGEPREFDSPREAIDVGIGMIHQHFQLVDPMSVVQNVVLGHEPTESGLVDTQSARSDIEDICSTYGFEVDEYLDTPVEELGVGIQQHVEIVKSLYRGADVLILDEPTAVLTPQEVENLFHVMNELAAEGHSLIFITHKLDEAMAIADDITVLRDGNTIGTVDARDTSREELARMMVGRDVLFDTEDRETSPGETIVDIDGLHVKDDRGLEQVNSVEFEVQEGEIFGIAGVEGNGQSELVEALTGLRDAASGNVVLDGSDITHTSRRRHIESDIAYIPEDRQETGLVQDYDLVRNALVGNQTIEPYANGGFLDWEAIREHADEIIAEYDVQPSNRDVEAASLSGGNQQKFVVGRELGHDPRFVVASHPTRGVDIGSIEFIHERLQEMRDEGVAILLVSSKLDEIQQLSDRIAVMYEGEFVDVVGPEDVTEEQLGLMMAGHTHKEIVEAGEEIEEVPETSNVNEQTPDRSVGS
jgi:ABC-type uncharacterized transport system ATPase subunit